MAGPGLVFCRLGQRLLYDRDPLKRYEASLLLVSQEGRVLCHKAPRVYTGFLPHVAQT